MAFATHRSGVERELSLARSLVVPSAAHREGLLAGLSAAPGPERWHVLPPPPPEAASPARSNPRPLPGTGSPLLLGSWGHMSPHKGTDLLLEALRLVAERCSVELHLAGAPGDAAFEAELLSLAAGLAVHFHGPFEPEDLPAHPVTAVHALVYPSRAPESHGLVLDEARALGLPAVLPRLGAFPERAREDPEGCDGVLFHAPGDAADLARVLCRLADEEGLIARLGKGTRTFVASTGAGITEGAWARRLWELCAAAAEEGAPETVEPDWFDVPMAREGERLWDAALSRTPPEELAP
jgi:glycosyltransferase involved in cell wall biosynthesis